MVFMFMQGVGLVCAHTGRAPRLETEHRCTGGTADLVHTPEGSEPEGGGGTGSCTVHAPVTDTAPS